jgi:hypothetical protein
LLIKVPYILALGVVMMVPISRPCAVVFLLLDGHLNRHVSALLFILLGAILLWHLVTFRHRVFAAVFLGNIVAFGYINVVAALMWNLGTLFLVVVGRLALLCVCGLALLFLFVGTLLFVGGFTVLFGFVIALFVIFCRAFGHFVLLTCLFVFGFVFGDVVFVLLLALPMAGFFGDIVVEVVALLIGNLFELNKNKC